MAIVKPSWLHNYLLAFNFSIFGTSLPVGDTIERAVDYLLGEVDKVLIQSVAAYDKAVEAGDRVESAEQYLGERITREIDQVIAQLEAAVPGIAGLWNIIRPQVIEVVDASVDQVVDLARDLQGRQDALEVLLDRIRDDYALRSWVLQALEANQQTTEERLLEVQRSFTSYQEENEGILDRLRRFFDDPIAFIIEGLLGWITGNLERLFSAVESALWGEV